MGKTTVDGADCQTVDCRVGKEAVKRVMPSEPVEREKRQPWRLSTSRTKVRLRP